MYECKITLSDGTVLEKTAPFRECVEWAIGIRQNVDYNVGIDIGEVK